MRNKVMLRPNLTEAIHLLKSLWKWCKHEKITIEGKNQS